MPRKPTLPPQRPSITAFMLLVKVPKRPSGSAVPVAVYSSRGEWHCVTSGATEREVLAKVPHYAKSWPKAIYQRDIVNGPIRHVRAEP